MEPQVAIIIAIVVWIAIGLIARTDTIIGKILRVIWNVLFSIAAIIPFCGWMTRFVITKNEEEKKAKEELVRAGDENDSSSWSSVEASARKSVEADEARRAKLEADRKAVEEDLQRRAYQSLGRTDVRVNSDGSMAKIGDGDYVPVEELKREFQ